ncbi:cAMP-binding domain of CRP or a regulatory subunit of cAMP-dependent protein kinases [Marinobacter persicus]|uniref:cAMP-binding domain of CRP or a regulatory subunit of cAMP-dependent protein kinases n=1 Tax=Marinobacter persicus TaxID=930118 RepID=A0A1I3VTX8_9GAMM|nr:Crp/Fnr family transcriptional regulator [Marinobacter persicus]NWO08389.1 Crp/Fnr family transcriptional regulator [Alteromonadaceae bacterium]SFJ98579.1 cAMP-binding domain of CRP or a regulatory subunit of cAMP-dependent protein kinases [Marinobacter persicus]
MNSRFRPPETSPTTDIALLNGLSRAFGISLNGKQDGPDACFLGDLARLFHPHQVDAETSLEKHDSPWTNVYLIESGVLRLFRESPTGKVAVHHFFSEGDLVWPVFGRSRTVRNTLCLTSSLPAKLWVADFSAFRAAIQNHGDGRWQKFALVLTEEIAELTSMREYRKQTMPATQRYQILLEEYPELVRRVPDNQLASWLGVVPATFSRLKTGHR